MHTRGIAGIQGVPQVFFLHFSQLILALQVFSEISGCLHTRLFCFQGSWGAGTHTPPRFSPVRAARVFAHILKPRFEVSECRHRLWDRVFEVPGCLHTPWNRNRVFHIFEVSGCRHTLWDHVCRVLDVPGCLHPLWDRIFHLFEVSGVCTHPGIAFFAFSRF